jgi:hypothetical protein
VTRKRIIGSAVAVVIAVALAIAFLPAREEAGIKVIDVSANGPDRVVFTVTNTSRATLAWYMHLQVMKEGSFPTPRSPEAAQHNELKGSTANSYDLSVPTGKRWRLAVWYDRPISEQFFLRWRGKLARFAFGRTWYRFGNWVQPDPIMLWAYGPEMLGNKPAAFPAGHSPQWNPLNKKAGGGQ